MLRMPTVADRARMIDVAQQREPADLVIVNAHVLLGSTGEIRPANITVAGNWVVAVGEARAPIGPGTETVDAEGRVVVPGLIDAHFHIEGSLVTVHELASVLLPRGVTTLMCDPHEIGNVLGPEGMVALIDEAESLPLKVFFRVPLEIPGTPGLETTGGSLTDSELAALIAHPSAISVAGDCSPTWLLDPDQSHLSRLHTGLAAGLTVNGQEPGLDEIALNAFVAAGPQDTHIATSCDMLVRELRVGLGVIINDMPGQFPDEELSKLAGLLSAGAIDCRSIMMCADDVHPNRLLEVGGVDAAVRRAIRCGVRPVDALRMATINAATHYRIGHLYGSVAPGRVADLVILDDLPSFTPASVIADGRPVGGRSAACGYPPYPDWAYHTVHLPRPMRPEDFQLRAPGGAVDGDRVEVRGIYPGLSREGRLLPGTEKEEHRVTGRVIGGQVELEAAEDAALVAVVERHTASGRIGRGVVVGFGFRGGAIASTVNHDNHNLLIVGVDIDDMACAANAVVSLEGGIAIAKGRQVLASIALPIAGLLSDQPISEVATAVDRLESSLVDDLGIDPRIVQPFMLLQMFALANIPLLGLTDLGLIDVLGRCVTAAVVRRT